MPEVEKAQNEEGSHFSMNLLNRKLRRKKLVKKIVKIQIITYSPLKRILNLAMKKLGLIQM